MEGTLEKESATNTSCALTTFSVASRLAAWGDPLANNNTNGGEADIGIRYGAVRHVLSSFRLLVFAHIGLKWPNHRRRCTRHRHRLGTGVRTSWAPHSLPVAAKAPVVSGREERALV